MVATRSSLEFGTVFDMNRSFKHASGAYNRVIDLIERSIMAFLISGAQGDPVEATKLSEDRS